MVFWTLAIALTALACAALYYAAAGRAVNAAAGSAADPVSAHHRLQLTELEADIAAGRLGEAEGLAAKGELAREVLRQRGEAASPGSGRPGAGVVALSLGAVALITFVTYGAMGKPELPALPLEARPQLPAGMTLDDAMARIEQQLTVTPDDLRGWTVIAPVYMQSGRFADAERAYRRILELAPATADAEADLAEALLMQNGGAMTPEALTLLQSAAGRDPAHVRSRFYLAADATQRGDFAAAQGQWQALIALGGSDAPWIETARNGLTAAEAGLAGETPADPQQAEIRAMVEGLDARLKSEGGTIEEWTRLVRSRLVLAETDAAQAAYDAAVAAYPDPAQRAELDALARSAQLAGGGG